MRNLVPYTCFSCRCTFKRPFEKKVFYRKCPTCSKQTVMMDIRFRPPKKSDDKQWKKVEYLVAHGFFFQKIYRKEGYAHYREKYPKSLEEAKEFVLKYKEQAYEFL
ncbi:hypothetical protein [Thalassotalea litorea]|uniref:hypothetical protein n=1 Tax=Thalassotalea litorea TaxID=2020715 RepID=UPI003734E861